PRGQRYSGLRRVVTPLRLLRARLREPCGQPSLRILDDDLADVSQVAVSQHLASLLHHRIARIVVREGEDDVVAANETAELFGVLQLRGHRLVTDDVDASLDKSFRDRKMEEIWSHDGHEIDALVLRARSLSLGHLFVGTVHPVRVDEALLTLPARLIWVRRKRPRHQFSESIEGGRFAVNLADEGTRAASDHAISELAMHRNG